MHISTDRCQWSRYEKNVLKVPLVTEPSFESAYAENRAVIRAYVKVQEGLDLDIALRNVHST